MSTSFDESSDLSPKELKDIFNNRFSSRKKDWNIIKSDFVEIGLENILAEELDGLTFHTLYFQITSFSDEEIFDHLIDEL